MNRNWFLFAFALVALASCSVEKRVYQPGYHIEWNHFAKQDANQDVSQDAMQDASRDVSQDLSENLETDVTQSTGQSINSDLELILLIILALLLPALTIFLLEGFSKNFWIALLLMICGLSLASSIFLVGAILEVIAIVLAIGVVLDKS